MAIRLGLFAAAWLAAVLPAGAETGRPAPAQGRTSVVLIFNHGTARPARQHECDETRDVPALVREITADNEWELHYLCSEAADEGVRGSYTYKRADEILAVVAQYRRKGIPARRIFLLGHSAGGWSSLMAARKDHSGFNAIIAFAPAFAGPRSEEQQYPIWRRQLQPQQIAYLSSALLINALIFAFNDDTFDRPEELAPLKAVPGLRIVPFSDCEGGGHRTAYTACFRRAARPQVEAFIKARLGSDR